MIAERSIDAHVRAHIRQVFGLSLAAAATAALAICKTDAWEDLDECVALA